VQSKNVTTPPAASPASSPRWPILSVLASLWLSGGAFLLAGAYRTFLAWMLPLSGGGLVLYWLWDTDTTMLFPYWLLQLLTLVWVAAWFLMLVHSSRVSVLGTRQPVRIVLFLLLGGTLLFFFRQQVRDLKFHWYAGFDVETRSMEPTLQGEITDEYGNVVRPFDSVLAEFVTYRHRRPQRGEIALFMPHDVPAELPGDIVDPIAKRIVGLPGERVRIDPPHIYINGKKLLEPPVFRKMAESKDGYLPAALPSMYSEYFDPPAIEVPEDEITLGPDEYFVLHDDPESAYPDRPKLDSRYFGALPGEVFFGRIIIIVKPPERQGWVE